MQSITYMATDTLGGPSGSPASPPGHLMLPGNMGRKEGMERPGTAHSCERPCSWPPILLTLTLAPVPLSKDGERASETRPQPPGPINSPQRGSSCLSQSTSNPPGKLKPVQSPRPRWEEGVGGSPQPPAPEQGLSSRSWTRRGCLEWAASRPHGSRRACPAPA